MSDVLLANFDIEDTRIFCSVLQIDLLIISIFRSIDENFPCVSILHQ